MNDPADYRQYICGSRSVVCVRAYSLWDAQRQCCGAVKDPRRERCWYVSSDGICQRDKMEHEGA